MSKVATHEDRVRLSKRLVYILRYGALKEGLVADSNGYVEIDEIMKVPLFKQHIKEDVVQMVKTSMSYRKLHRYEWKEKEGGRLFARAAYNRNFEKSPYHAGTKVKTLFESTIESVLNNLELYDLEDFPDEYIIKIMIHRLKRKKAMTAKALATLLVPTLTRVDLDGIYLTMKSLRLLWTQCPHLTGLGLRNCDYIITDTVLQQLVKNLPKLEELNLCRCSCLTGKSLSILSSRLPCLKTLHIAQVPAIGFKDLQAFLDTASNLKFLDAYSARMTEEEYNSLLASAKRKAVNLVLKNPSVKQKTSEEIEEEEEEEEEEGNELRQWWEE